MSDPTKFDFKNTSNSVPQTYNDLLVPRLFEPWARLLLEEAGLSAGESVLDVASGPGTVAHLASLVTGSKGKVTATDISPLMLDVARSKPLKPESAPIEFIESAAHPLNAEDNSFDLTVCQQGLQFFPEPVKALEEMVRVTRSGGRIALAVWGTIEQCPIFHEILSALRETLPQDIANLMNAPFSLSDPDRLRNLGEDAGMKSVRIKNHSLPLVFEQGVDQTLQVLEATPLAPQIAELPSREKNSLYQSLRDRMSQFLQGEECHSQSMAHILVSEV